MYYSQRRAEGIPNLPRSQSKRFTNFLCEPLLTTAGDLRALSCLLDLHKRDPSLIREGERAYFEDTFAAAKHSLVSFPAPKDVDVHLKTVNYYRQNCFRIASLLYLNTALRTCPTAGLLNTMTERLMDSLHESDLSDSWAPFQDILLWILFMGICGSLSITTKGWFLLEFKRLLAVLNLEKRDDVLRLFKALIYRRTVLDDVLFELWDENFNES